MLQAAGKSVQEYSIAPESDFGKGGMSRQTSRTRTAYRFLLHHQSKPEDITWVKECTKIIEALGGVVLPEKKEFDLAAEPTHLVTRCLRRSEKPVCAVARGCFIVSELYLKACRQAGVFVDEAEYPAEYGHETQAIWPGAAERWHLSWHETNKGPLSGLRVLIHGAVKPNLAVLSRMIRAGGGQVFLEKKGEGFTVDYAVLGNDKPNTSEKTPATSLANTSLYWRNWAKRHDIKVIKGVYFVEMICQDQAPNIDDYVLT